MRYSDFTLRFEPGESQQTYRVLARSVTGAAKGLFSIPLALQKGSELLEELWQTLSTWMKGRRYPQGSPSLTLAERAGTELFHALFRESILDLLDFEIGRYKKQPHMGLSLRLHFAVEGQDLARLESLPWELLRDPRTHYPAVRRIQAIRSIVAPHLARPLPWALPLRVLAVVSHPSGLPAPNLGRDQYFLRQALAREPGVELTVLESPTPNELRRALLEKDFQILHYSGHGSFDERSQRASSGLGGVSDDSPLVSAENLANLLKVIHGPHLVVLDACHSGPFAGKVTPSAEVAGKLVQSGFPAVVGMHYPISDRAAFHFSRTFYERLAAGDPVEVAVSEGRFAIAQEDPQEWAIPCLYLQVSSGELFIPSDRLLDLEVQERDRHAELVDKKFQSSLTEAEQAELLQLQEVLDDADAKVYEPIEKKLELLLAKLRQRSR